MEFKSAGYKIHKFADCLSATDIDELYQILITHWNSGQKSKLKNIFSDNNINFLEPPSNLKDEVERMQFCDILTYLTDDILTKVDRASMANSLEVRVPLLDHRILETSWRVPLSFKLYKNKSKFILKNILINYIPKDLFERPKMGFGIPLNSWLRNQLYDWSIDIITNTDWENDLGLNKNVIVNHWNNF